jgi:hypothetical protein
LGFSHSDRIEHARLIAGGGNNTLINQGTGGFYDFNLGAGQARIVNGLSTKRDDAWLHHNLGTSLAEALRHAAIYVLGTTGRVCGLRSQANYLSIVLLAWIVFTVW